jgi:hypothetical protein
MPRVGKEMEGGSPRASIADDTYSLSTARDDDERTAAPGETTSLLSAGTRASYDPADGNASPPPDDSWVGYAEFDGLPWYQRPSVRSSSLTSSKPAVLLY